MQINVAQLLMESVGSKRKYVVDELVGDGDGNCVRGEVTLIRTNRGILVTGDFTTDIKGTCDRCLGPACVHAAFSMEDEYFPVTDINTGARLQVEPDAFTIDQNHVLDLGEAIRQYIIMSVPTKLLCDPDCPGICPVCGKELARGDCGHRGDARDRRWDKLARLDKENKT